MIPQGSSRAKASVHGEGAKDKTELWSGFRNNSTKKSKYAVKREKDGQEPPAGSFLSLRNQRIKKKNTSL